MLVLPWAHVCVNDAHVCVNDVYISYKSRIKKRNIICFGCCCFFQATGVNLDAVLVQARADIVIRTAAPTPSPTFVPLDGTSADGIIVIAAAGGGAAGLVVLCIFAWWVIRRQNSISNDKVGGRG